MKMSSIADIIESLGLPNRLMTEAEVAEVTSRAVQTMRNDRHNRRGLPYIKIGRSIRYAPADVAADILANRIDPEAVQCFPRNAESALAGALRKELSDVF